MLGAGSKQRSDDETISEWGIGKGAIIAKGAVRIWSHDIALCFDYRNRRDSGRGQTSAVVMANSWTLSILSRGCR